MDHRGTEPHRACDGGEGQRPPRRRRKHVARSRSASTRSACDITEENRRDYRELLFRTTDAMKNHISGVILYDETIRQKAKDGTPLVKLIEDGRRHSRHQGRSGREAAGRLARARPSPKASMVCANVSSSITSSARASPNGAR